MTVAQTVERDPLNTSGNDGARECARQNRGVNHPPFAIRENEVRLILAQTEPHTLLRLRLPVPR